MKCEIDRARVSGENPNLLLGIRASKIKMDLSNPVIQLCMAGAHAEFEHRLAAELGFVNLIEMLSPLQLSKHSVTSAR